MGYQLLTGATGLLGSYLLRDRLLAGQPMAVLARSTGAESAEQRIESLMAAWERGLPFKLPRPVVLSGNLCEPQLGLSSDQQRWFQEHCCSVLHSGASLRFVSSATDGEPRRTNVEGTRCLLDLCRRAGIRQFHHVSTAYTCGLREGRIMESELDEGQQFGNDYEQSKIESERLVRSADFLDPPTIYRPSIIVGDSRTGYTSTFHGFYTPLRAAFSAAPAIDPSQISGEPLMAALGLSGSERKNLVPVDWVSAVITRIVGQPELHGQTYHVTTPEPVPVSLINEMMETAVRMRLNRNGRAPAPTKDGLDIVRIFLSQMQTYRAYWRDDPQFDRQNLLAALPDLPCPEMDAKLLGRLIDFAIRVNFGWPSPAPVVADFSVAEHLGKFLPLQWHADDPDEVTQRIGLQVNGPGGGCWGLLVRNGQILAAERGLSPRARICFYLNTHTFREIVSGRLTAKAAAGSGRVLIEATQLQEAECEDLLQAIASARCSVESHCAAQPG